MPNQTEAGRPATNTEPGQQTDPATLAAAALRSRHDGGFYEEIVIELPEDQERVKTGTKSGKSGRPSKSGTKTRH